MNPELEDILNDLDYDQSRLQDWFKKKYGDNWATMWNRYLETGWLPS